MSRDAQGNYNHAVFQLTDDELYKCPFVMMTEPGGSFFDEMEAARLRFDRGEKQGGTSGHPTVRLLSRQG